MTKTNTTLSLNCNPDCLQYHGGPDHSDTCPLYDLPQCPCRTEIIDGPHDQICYDSGWIAQPNRAAAQLAMRRQPQEEQQNRQQGTPNRWTGRWATYGCIRVDEHGAPCRASAEVGQDYCHRHLPAPTDDYIAAQPQEEQQNQQQGRRERLWQCRHCGKTGITTQTEKTECAQGCPPNGKSGAACSIRKAL